MKYLKRAIRDKYVIVEPSQDRITYLPQGKTRKYSNPEEKVQLQTYLSLLYAYHYPVSRIRVCEKVTIGSSVREADLVVFHDDHAKDPFIVIECKRRNVSAKAFQNAIDQGFSYAAATHAEYVWATSGDQHAYFEVWDSSFKERLQNRINRIPRFDELNQKLSTLQRLRSWFDKKPILTDAIGYTLVLCVFTVGLSKLTVIYYKEITDFFQPIIQYFNGRLNWLYNTIVFCATLLSLIFGGIFMRSHRFFNTPRIRKRANHFFLSLILFVPAWYMGISYPDPQWWYETRYLTHPTKEFIFLLPYVRSIPFTFLLVFVLIWLLSRTRR